MIKNVLLVSLCLLFLGCKEEVTTFSFRSFTQGSPSITGKESYLKSPMVTAGDRVYSVGHQDGTFPELGWHITGEMGGIWNHPIKLMDGFEISLIEKQTGDRFVLNDAEAFTNFPYANKHDFTWANKHLELERWQFVPVGKNGLAVQLLLKNNGQAKEFQVGFEGFVDLLPTWLGERTQMVDSTDTGTFDATKDAWMAKDDGNPWFVVFGSDHTSFDHNTNKSTYAGKGILANLYYNIAIGEGETTVMNFTIAGSTVSEVEAWNTYQSISDQLETDVAQKRARYESIANSTRLTIPDKEIEQAF
ncbi:MAG: hypothetical protein AAF466_01955 [Bacteroidota bacterium]